MTERSQLIARKGEIQAQIAQIRREIEQLRRQFGPKPDRRQQRTLDRLEGKLEHLMGQEYAVRIQIDTHG